MAKNQQVLTMAEAADLMRLNYCTLSRKAKSKAIPCFRIGSKVMFRLETLNAWITAQERQGLEASAEPESGTLRRIAE